MKINNMNKTFLQLFIKELKYATLPHDGPLAAAAHPCQQTPTVSLTCHLIHLRAIPKFLHKMLQTDDHPLKKKLKTENLENAVQGGGYCHSNHQQKLCNFPSTAIMLQ
jgi:hypothetical protein